MDYPASPGPARKTLESRSDGPAAVSAAKPLQPGQTITPWLLVVLVVVLFSGGLFGYDQGVISGALHGIAARFSLSPLVIEVVTSWVTLGALFGALAGGELGRPDRTKASRSDRGCIVHSGLSRSSSGPRYNHPDRRTPHRWRRSWGGRCRRPLYAAELAPTTWRGRFVSAYQLAITVGIFLAYLVDGWLSKSDAWRVMWERPRCLVCFC